MTAGKGREILWFWEFRCLMGSSLCSLLLRNYSTDFSNDDANQLREQCRYATCTSFWPWPLHDCRSRSRNTLFCEFRCLTGSSLCSLLLRYYWTDFYNDNPINWGNNVDVQCVLHFDLDPSMTAGQGHKILWFCEFRCLTGSSLISPMMIPINWWDNVDVRRALHFDLDPSMTAGKGYEILWFWEFRCLTGWYM